MALKKNFLLLFCLIIISSCSSTRDQSNVERIYDLYKNRNKEIKIVDIPEAKLSGLPYDIIEIRTSGILKQGVFLSMTSRSNYKNFTSGMGQIITMNGALISKTFGMDVYLNSLEIKDKNPFDNYTKIQDFPERVEKKYKFLLPTNSEKEFIFKCEIKIYDKENIILLKKNFTLNKVVEHCLGKEESHKNIYWVDDKGFVFKSKQWLSTNDLYAEINVLKRLKNK